jgi:hypothetical protein
MTVRRLISLTLLYFCCAHAAALGQTAAARDTAIVALSLTEWAGRDEWYLSLFKDPTLLSPSDGHYGFDPLTTLFDTDPEKNGFR